MRDKRPVDELTIEELERVLAIRRREARQDKLQRYKRAGRVVESPVPGKQVQHPPASAFMPTPEAAPPALPPQPVPVPIAAANGTAPRFEDAPDELQSATDADHDRFWRSFVNQALLLVEIVAVLGLVYIGVNMVQSVGKLEEETAAAQRMADEQRLAGVPTIAPTPQLRLDQIVLPGGHTPPTAPGGAQFNLNEIPANLLPVVQSQIFQPQISRPARTPQTALRLIVPDLNLDQSIVQGTDWEALKQGVGQLQNGANPGDNGSNIVFAAHNDIYGELFRYLDQLETGDRFQVQTESEIFTYEITGWDIYEPTDVHVLDSRGRSTATLISCYPYQVSDKRIVVFADQVDT